MTALIDACAHPGTDQGLASLIPYMDDAWAARFRYRTRELPAFQGASAEDLLKSEIEGEPGPAGVLLVPRDAVNASPIGDSRRRLSPQQTTISSRSGSHEAIGFGWLASSHTGPGLVGVRDRSDRVRRPNRRGGDRSDARAAR